MSSSGVKFSGVKIVPQSDLRAGTTSGNSWQRAKHRDIFLGTWNVRTLYSSRPLEILTRELDRTGLDIVALQESRWSGEGSQESGKFTLYYGGATKPEFGTGFLVRRNILSAIRDIKFVSDRISYIILKVVNVYGPTEASVDKIKYEFYEEIESVFDRLSRYHMKIVLGDFNAKVGREDIFFEIHNGLKQGDALSPLLFNLVLEQAIKFLKDKEGVQLNARRYMDNMHILRSNTRKFGLEVNVNKTKYMVIRRNASCNANGQLMTNEGNFEEVAAFNYVGALITNRNEIQKEIKHRLNSGNACYYALQRLLSSQLL
ncbi:hypothetical protein C0J52_12067 [Blattella germanica]|nr:hypothetical protein C0J52_12067 [Blattella germanica]